MTPSGHMTSLRPGEGSSSVALLKGSPPFLSALKVFFSNSWELFLIRCERSKVRDVVCVQIVKPSEESFFI